VIDSKTCRDCGETKPLYEFHVDRQTKDGRRHNCAICATAYQIARRDRVRGRPPRRTAPGRKVMAPGVITLAKSCTRCGNLRQAADFTRANNASDQLSNVCRFCQQQSWATRDADARARDRRRLLKRVFGLTPEEFDDLLISQSGRCAICNEPLIDLTIDHDHQTGAVRGLLDSWCNRGLGHFRDDPDRLRSAAEYLEGGQPLFRWASHLPIKHSSSGR
jgi:hypothetical protein